MVQQLEVFQICDSTFPIGTFNHSYGMENYLVNDTITDAKSFESWLQVFLKTQFTYGEGFIIQLVFQAMEEQKFDDIWQYDQILYAATLARETREAGLLIAQQMLTLVLDLSDSPLLRTYQQAIQEKKAVGNPAVVFALFLFEKGISAQESIYYYGYSIVSTMVQNAVRTVPLGQKSGQLIVKASFPVLQEVIETIATLDASYLGASVPGIEIAQMNHETQTFRLFMS
ncbi:urease accessory protein UreF [Enterococcus sp. LJL98]